MLLTHNMCNTHIMCNLFHDLYLKRRRQIYRVARGTQIRMQDKISDYYFYVGLNFVSAAIVFTGSSVLRYSNEIKSPGLSGSRSRYSRVANRRYAKIESSSIVQKKLQHPRVLHTSSSNRFIFFHRYYKTRKIKITYWFLKR